MGLIQSLFNIPQQIQPGWQGQLNYQPSSQAAPQPMPQSLIQSILSSRLQQQPGDTPQQITPDLLNAISQGLQPSSEDIGNAAIARFAQKNPSITAQSMTDARLEPQLKILQTLGNVNQSQIQLAQLGEMMRHNRATENNNPNMQPITTAPTTQGNQPQNTPLPPMGSPERANLIDFIVTSGPNAGIPTSKGAINSAAAGQASLDPLINGGQGNITQQSQLTPLYKGNEPYTDGLEKGYQWAQDAQGNKRAVQIPGTIQKGTNGEILTTDAQGNVTQQIPQNPVMRQKFEQNIQQIAQKFDELHRIGGTVEAGAGGIKGAINNKLNQVAGTKTGQAFAEGTRAQALRGEIQNLIKQTTPLYMQAMGITPGMERAVSAQQMLQDALGGAVGQSRQQNMFALSNLSKQAGTGQLAQKHDALQSAQDAIARGADRNAVAQRLQQFGIDPGELE